MGWQERAVGRSIEGVAARSRERAARFVAAARDIVTDAGNLDFAVQDVVRRAGLSLRSFYQHFDGKDDLVVALYEEIVHASAERARRQAERIEDPIARLRFLVFRFYRERGAFPASMAAEVQQLVRARPREMRAALAPLLEVFADGVRIGQAGGVIRSGEATEHALHLLLVVLTYTQARGQSLLGGDWPTPSREKLWDYCLRSLKPDSTAA
jgi:AcrR family transcriptional regulator